MTDFPERISISPVHRQKREDDFYLVDREAFPGKGKGYVRADISDSLKAEVDRLNSVLDAIMSDAAWTPKHPACEKIMQRIKELRVGEAKP